MVSDPVYIDNIAEAIIAMAISSVLFLLVYILVKLCFSFVFSIVYRRVGKDAEQLAKVNASVQERSSKKWGALTGAVSAFISVIIFFAPLTGSLQMVSKIIVMIDTADERFFALENARKQVDAFDTYANDGLSMMLYNMGGEIIYTSAASTVVNGETIYIVNEIEIMQTMIEDFMEMYPMLLNPDTFTKESMEEIETFCKNLEESRVTDLLVAEFLPKMSRAWLYNEPYMGITRPVLSETVTPAFDGILKICECSDIYSAKDNVISLLRIYAIIISSGILKAGDDFESISRCIQQTDLIARLNAEIDRNPNMAMMKTYTAEIAMRAIANEIYDGAIGGITDEESNLLAERLADAIHAIDNKGYGTMEEKISAMTIYAQEYLYDYGVDLPEEIAAPIAEIMFSQLGGTRDISADDIHSFLKGYITD
jgi:hypothetical protein